MDSHQTTTPHLTALRLATLSRVGAALMREQEEAVLHQRIATTARDLVSAEIAALTLRPVNDEGEPLVPAEGRLFHLAAIVGVTRAQEAQLRRMPLGGEGLLAPIFRHGVPVLVADALAHRAEAEPTQDPRQLADQVAHAYAQGRLPTERLRAVGVPHGHLRVRSFLGAPVLDPQGEVRGGLLLGYSEPGHFTDEDEIMLVGLAAQAAIALEQARWSRIAHRRTRELEVSFESSIDGIILVDLHGQISRENQAASRLRRRLQEAPEGQASLDALLFAPARQAFTGQAFQEQVVQVDVQGSEARVYLVNASPLCEPAFSPQATAQDQVNRNHSSSLITGAVVVWHDVTEARRKLVQQREQQETEAQRALLQLILDELPISVSLVRGHEARLLLANRAATNVFGAPWQPGQSLPEFLQEHQIQVLGTDGHPLAREQFATLRAVRQRETVFGHQETICRPDGTTMPVLVHAVALDLRQKLALPSLLISHPEPAALVVHQDVTALKEVEQFKDEFISIIAHELRTPLAIIKGFVQTLLTQTAQGKGPELAAWQAKSLQGIDLATARVIDLANDLLDVTRVQAGRLELQREPADLVALTRRVLSRRQLTTERHTLTLATALSQLVLHVDPRRIEQVLANLLGNAITYSPEGGPIEVTIHTDGDAHEALLSVRDQGIGIPPHDLGQVFERFTRAANAQTCGIGGTGLGLYLCRELIAQHGGRIWVESTEGQGSTFFVALPLPEQPPSFQP
ncbi:MAG TPA: ATP-binding protein [Ktedonobacteraceae bacterium]|nr:ATP-binding protein [Ktedonobacteraceae bacterium]